MTQKSRREFLAGLGTVAAAAPLVTSPIPWPQRPGLTLTPALKQQFGRIGFAPDEQLKQYSNNRVGVHLAYEQDADESDSEESNKDALVEWLDSDDDREILRENDAINTITAQVPVSDIASGVFGDAPVDELGFLDDDVGVDAELEVGIPEPVDLDTAPETPSFGGFGDFVASAFGFSLSATDKVAHDDAEAGTVAEARDVTGAPDSLVDSAATGSVTVAVIDTGFNAVGGDILGDTVRILDASKNMLTDEDVGADGLSVIEDGNGHGTHVASTIAADPSDSDLNDDFRGFLPDSDLLILKALDDDGSGSTADIADAITYAADEGADLICLSLGSPLWSVQLDRALAYAEGAESIPFVAAGNNRSMPNPTPHVNSPADSPSAISVAAGEVRPPEETRGGSFSAVGPDPGTADASDGETTDAGPDIASTGVELTALTADANGSLNSDGETLSGTSMACPSAVGAAGLILAETGVSTREEMEQRLEDYAAPAPQMGVEEAGAGWVDAEAAIGETEPDQTQKEARNDEAEARDEAWRSLSTAYGQQIARYFL